MGSASGRRRVLRQIVAAGLLPLFLPRLLQAMSRMPAGRAIYRLQGQVRINGQAADDQSRIGVGDVIETGHDGLVVFVVGSDVFMVKANSYFEVSGTNGLVQLCRLVSGAVLQVFGSGAKKLETGEATIGIRGTAVYMETRTGESYICTCYGTAEMVSRLDPTLREVVKTVHHESPRYFRRTADGRPVIERAPVKNHSDDELILLESLVNRSPPFVLLDNGYR